MSRPKIAEVGRAASQPMRMTIARTKDHRARYGYVNFTLNFI